MAGNYPDSPSWRMAYDRDGTQAVWIDSYSNVVTLTSGNLTTLNNEASDYYQGSGAALGSVRQYLCFLFPELRDIDAFFGNFYSTSGALPIVQTSLDTTNGLDGTWTTLYTAPAGNYEKLVKPNYRTGVVSGTALAVRGVRFGAWPDTFGPSNIKWTNIHLYGEPAPGENPNRLALWHPTLDQRVSAAYFDWGNVPRSSSADRTFRVKNLSSSLTANSIRVAYEALTDASPSVPGQHTVSSDGSTFTAQVNIGSLAPGAISGVLTMRRVTPSNAVLSLWSMRVFAEASTWS